MSQPTGSRPGADWAEQTTDTIVRLVGTVRERTSGPLIQIARAVVYGLLAAILGIAALVVLAIVLIRVLDLLPGGVWLPYLITGALFTLGGMLAWRQRHSPDLP